jgi:hypothetical protein
MIILAPERARPSMAFEGIIVRRRIVWERCRRRKRKTPG